MYGFEEKFSFKNENPGWLHYLEKSENFIFERKVRDSQHFIQNSGKIREFEKIYGLK